MPQLGLIGLGTMGASIARNAAHKGARVIVFNRTKEKTDAFITAHSTEGKLEGASTLAELTIKLSSPRAIILMVNAGAPVDAVLAELIPLLSAGDTIIDAGNSHFLDTERRVKELKEKGISFIGMGVSGGERGALEGPSMMPGGDSDAYANLEGLFSKMAARDGSRGACITHIGTGGAGHFVKMVHNGIEYGDMQLIAESYHLLKELGKLSNADLSTTFGNWNNSRLLSSYLIEITANIFAKKDAEGSSDLIDIIEDAAQQKGTGKWTTQLALDLGVAIPTITAAVDARAMSADRAARKNASTILTLETKMPSITASTVRDALILSKVISYAQGFQLILKGSTQYNWNIALPEICRIWRGGCIIRSKLLKDFEQAFRDTPDLQNLLLAPSLKEIVLKKHSKLRQCIAKGAAAGIPLPAMSASLAWLDSMRSHWLPQNLTQAQRDYFGAHTYRRVDRDGSYHTEWEHSK